MQHIGAQVLGEGPSCSPALPAPAQGGVLQPQRLRGNQAHVDSPEVALGLGLRRILGHLVWGGRLGGAANLGYSEFPPPAPGSGSGSASAPTLAQPHLAEAAVGGEVVADGVLPALVIVPEEGEHGLYLTDDLKPQGGRQAP